MTANLLFELKKIFYSFLPDIIAVNLILVSILFLVFFIIHLFKKRRRYVDDTVPYVVYLKENIEQLVEEAEILKKKLESTKYKNINENSKANKGSASEDEIERYQSLIEEKDGEISVLKEELSKYEKNQSASGPLGSKNGSNKNDLSFTIEILKNENKELKEKLEEVSLIGGDSKNSSEEELRKHNLELSQKLEELKKQLAEYEIIEDELSELKILKEENFNLKEKLSVLGSNEPAPKLNSSKAEISFSDTTIEQETDISLEDIEKDFKHLASDEGVSSTDSEIKSQIEKEIDDELNRELAALETDNKDKTAVLSSKNEATSVQVENQASTSNKVEPSSEPINSEPVNKENQVSDEDLDLELVGLPSEEDALIEAEIKKLDSELEEELGEDSIKTQESIEINNIEDLALKDKIETESLVLKETEKNSDKNSLAAKIETDVNIQDTNKALADEFEKFLSES